jgi:glycine cleavage system H protein
MNFPTDIKYTKDHEWVRVEEGIGTVGITEYAQGELGDVVFVELPAVGASVKAHATFGTIEAVKAVSDLFAPLSGTVTEVNPELAKTPELVNREPYGKGWMVKIRIADPSEVAALMDAEAYARTVAK